MAFTKDKAIDIIKKLFAQSKSESEIGNDGAAELFEEKANKLLLDYGISKSEIELRLEKESESNFINDLGKTIIANPFVRLNAKTNLRKLWFEELAKIIAEAYSCKLDIDLQNGAVSFYGYDLDREIATFMFLKLAEQASELCERERKLAKSQVGQKPGFDFKSGKVINHPSIWMEDDVFIDSFHQGFREEIAVSMLKHKKEDQQKLDKVNDYFEQNKDQSNYYSYYRNQNVYQSSLNESAREIGKICGYNISRRASKTPSALVVKKSVIDDNDSVYILIDASGSMDGDKIEQAKQGAREYAKTATSKGYSVGLISFDYNIKHLLRPTKELNGNFEKVINSIEARNSTNLTDAIKAAQAHFLSRRRKRVIMIITDGMPDSQSTALSAANDAKRDGIEIQCIGTYDVNQEFVDKLVTRNGLGQLVENNRLALAAGNMAANL